MNLKILKMIFSVLTLPRLNTCLKKSAIIFVSPPLFKGGYGASGCTCIEVFKKELVLTTDKRLENVNNIMSVMPLRN